MACDSLPMSRHDSPDYVTVSSPPALLVEQYRHAEPPRRRPATKHGSRSAPIPDNARSGFVSARHVVGEIEDDKWVAGEAAQKPETRKGKKRKSDEGKEDKESKGKKRKSDEGGGGGEGEIVEKKKGSRGGERTKSADTAAAQRGESFCSGPGVDTAAAPAEITGKSQPRPVFKRLPSFPSSPVRFKSASQDEDPIVDRNEPAPAPRKRSASPKQPQTLSQQTPAAPKPTPVVSLLTSSPTAAAGLPSSPPEVERLERIVSHPHSPPGVATMPTIELAPKGAQTPKPKCAPIVPLLSSSPAFSTMPPPPPPALAAQTSKEKQKKAVLDSEDVSASIAKESTREKPPKPAGPKAARTVTEIAIAHYAAGNDSSEQSATKDTNGGFFERRRYDAKELLVAGDPQQSKKKKSTRAKKAPLPPAKFHSPSQMQRKMRRQDIVFGTSSQLATSDSPTITRHVQQALRESEATAYAPQEELGEETRHRLWNTSRRDENETVYHPSPREETADDYVDIDDFSGGSEQETAIATTLQEKKATLKLSTASRKPKTVLRVLDATASPLSNQQQQRAFSTAATPEPEVPRAEEQGAVEKAATEAAATSKGPTKAPAKGRKRAVKDPNAPKKPRRRPKETATEDLSAEATVQAPAKRKRRTKAEMAAARAQIAAQVDDGDPLGAVNARARENSILRGLRKEEDRQREILRKIEHRRKQQEQMEILLPQITQTVMAQPRSKNALKSLDCWYEKMLLYEPIILEQFTAWLNSGALHDLGGRTLEEDETLERELGVGEQGVMSLGSRGLLQDSSEIEPGKGMRGRLQSWVAQRWCEENSICCVLLEGMRGGAHDRKRRMAEAASVVAGVDDDDDDDDDDGDDAACVV